MDGTEANGTSRKRDPKRKAEINHSSLQIIKKQTRPAGLAEIGARRACNGRQETLHPDLALKSFKVVSLTTCAQEPEGSETGTQRIENMDTCRKNKTYLLCICQNNKHSLKKKMGKKNTIRNIHHRDAKTTPGKIYSMSSDAMVRECLFLNLPSSGCLFIPKKTAAVKGARHHEVQMKL